MFNKHSLLYALCAGALLVVVGVVVFYFLQTQEYTEVKELADTHLNEREYADRFSDIAREKGALYAFEVLRRTAFPSDINVHSIAHAVGYVLFQEKGISGMYDCTEEFRSACSHAIVIQALSMGGAHAIEDIVKTCKSAPGGKGAYAICSHGIGHGLVASSGYDFKSAVMQCSRIFEIEKTVFQGHRFMNASEECIGGAVMEMVQGAHDRYAWEQAVSTYLPIEDPFRPCTDAYVPNSLREACMTSLTQRFFGAAGIAEDLPAIEEYPNAMVVCASAGHEDERTACYGGFGKEFVFFSTQFDGGDVNNLSDRALLNVWDWCGNTDDRKGFAQCTSIAVDTLFWAGQNDSNSALRFCALAPSEHRTVCYTGLVENIRYFLQGEKRYEYTCDALPPEFQTGCMESASAFLFLPFGFGTIHL